MVGRVGGPRLRVERMLGAGAVACLLVLGCASGIAAAQEEPPPTDPPPTSPTTPPPTTPPPTEPPPTQPPTTQPPPTEPPETTTPPPVTTTPPSGGGGGRTPTTTARRPVTTVRPTSPKDPETTETTDTTPPETAPPPTEAPTTVPPATAPPTTAPPTTTGTTVALPAVDLDAAASGSVSGAGRVLSFMIIGALGTLAAVIFVGSRRRLVVDPAQMPLPPLGVPIEQARMRPVDALNADTSDPAAAGAAGSLAKGVGTSSTFTPFTRITSATGVVSGEVPVSGVAGAKAVHAAGAMHELYEPVDDAAALGPVTGEVTIADARGPELTSRFGTDGTAAPGSARTKRRGSSERTDDGVQAGPAGAAGATGAIGSGDGNGAGPGAHRWAVPRDATAEASVPAVAEPPAAAHDVPGTSSVEAVEADAAVVLAAPPEDASPSVLDLVTKAQRSTRPSG